MFFPQLHPFNSRSSRLPNKNASRVKYVNHLNNISRKYTVNDMDEIVNYNESTNRKNATRRLSISLFLSLSRLHLIILLLLNDAS